MTKDVIFIKQFILRKMINLGKIGGSHTSIFNLKKGLPNHIRSNKKGQKAITQAVKELINENVLLSKPSTNEQHLSINPKKITKIKAFLKIS